MGNGSYPLNAWTFRALSIRRPRTRGSTNNNPPLQYSKPIVNLLAYYDILEDGCGEIRGGRDLDTLQPVILSCLLLHVFLKDVSAWLTWSYLYYFLICSAPYFLLRTCSSLECIFFYKFWSDPFTLEMGYWDDCWDQNTVYIVLLITAFLQVSFKFWAVTVILYCINQLNITSSFLCMKY